MQDDPFRLPLTIAKQLKKCVRTFGASPAEMVRYLWINFAQAGEGVQPVNLSNEDWLNVVDEAASLGIRFVVVCVGKSFKQHPEVWSIAEWAQNAYDITVGFHTCAEELDDADVQEMKRLNPQRTMLFVGQENLSAFGSFADAGIRVCEAEVETGDTQSACDGPLSMVFVGHDGMLYSCGVVAGKTDFCLGHVLEQPLHKTLESQSHRRHIPKDAPRVEHGCDGCPRKMARRMKADE